MWQGEPGERGRTGDHGQDGQPGLAGRDGLNADAYEDPEINRAIAEALGEKKMRATDKRLWFLLAFLAVGMAVMFWALDKQHDENTERDQTFRRSIIAVCEKTNRDNRKVNDVLEQLAKSARTREDIPPEAREQRAERYLNLRLSITDCPPGGN